MSEGADGRLSATPMMKQWSELKAEAKDALLFFRLGDFYELFDEDAVKAAPILQVVLTSRNNRGTNANAVPLCGVPHGTIDIYLSRALDHGFSVALAEQTEEPGPGKTLVRREIVQWFTPGIRLLKTDERSHYAAVLDGSPDNWCLAAADVATGHTLFKKGSGLEVLKDVIDSFSIEDLRIATSSSLTETDDFEFSSIYQKPIGLRSSSEVEQILRDAFSISDLSELSLEKLTKNDFQILGTLIWVLNQAHPRDRLTFLLPHEEKMAIWVPASTRKNLNLFEPSGKSLFDLLDQTQTSMGRRRLREFLTSPTRDHIEIQRRQKLIDYFKTHSGLRKTFRSKLYAIRDIHRLLRRLKKPSDLFQLRQSLLSASEAANLLEPDLIDLNRWLIQTKELEELKNELNRCLQPSEDDETGWIADGVSETLDELRSLKSKANQLLFELENSLRQSTKISSLKIKFHQVFGYVIEVTSANKDKVPSSAKRIQTLANTERFKTSELESLEEKLLSLDSRIKEAEKSELSRLISITENSKLKLLSWADQLSSLDCFQSFAEVSKNLGWNTPRFSEDSVISIKDGVHPLSIGSFVPLSFELNSSSQQILLLTGPNMAGKSTLLRLAALSAYLHQMGSDIPAREAHLGLFDRIACRMGAQDDLSSGQSTFFVEMREVATMLKGATSKSLLVFDEIGRGTSTFDGMSLAWAITEEVHALQSLSLIATHYLELSELERILSRLKSYHLGVKEIEGKLVFTRKLVEGPASRSYGIQVARIADIPSRILDRAQQKLNQFEKKRDKPMPLFELVQTSSNQTHA